MGLENPQRKVNPEEIESLGEFIMMHSEDTPMPKREWSAFFKMAQSSGGSNLFFTKLFKVFGDFGEKRPDVQLRVMKLNEKMPSIRPM